MRKKHRSRALAAILTLQEYADRDLTAKAVMTYRWHTLDAAMMFWLRMVVRNANAMRQALGVMGEGPVAALFNLKLWKPQAEMEEAKPMLCEGTDRFQLLGRLAKYSSSVRSLVVSDLRPAFWDGGDRSLERRAWHWRTTLRKIVRN